MKQPGQVRLYAVPVHFKVAAAWVGELHRHNKEPAGSKFQIGAADGEGIIHGVAVAGRPNARADDDGLTIEITRTVTDGTPNVNSFLYGACWRTAREMGYLRCITYTQGDEPGTSLRAAGFRLVGERKPRASWHDSTKNPMWRAKRDPVGNGGVPRKVWEVLSGGTELPPRRFAAALRAECRLYGLTPEELLLEVSE
jgi:hypothetical protein